MTIVVAVSRSLYKQEKPNIHQGMTAIGADSVGIDVSSDLKLITNSKLWDYSFGTVGYTGSYRIPQVLHTIFRKVKKIKDLDHMLKIAEEISDLLDRKGYLDTQVNGHSRKSLGVDLLIATPQNVIWEIDNDLAVHEVKSGFAAIGIGKQVALGALDQILHYDFMGDALEAVERAINSAVTFSLGCEEGPIHTRTYNWKTTWK